MVVLAVIAIFISTVFADWMISGGEQIQREDDIDNIDVNFDNANKIADAAGMISSVLKLITLDTFL